ncbi:hypothetical protein E2C01_063549 [Portunus trituberculatus]|uniref:Uncharacterized protein n=1 Tax=Portunus trituberculatus TaxID=210409 RepID=A0A5B7HJ97_PORTR|nr:hypothetical protein [Portunus trituberculatus]
MQRARRPAAAEHRAGGEIQFIECVRAVQHPPQRDIELLITLKSTVRRRWWICYQSATRRHDTSSQAGTARGEEQRKEEEEEEEKHG